jgi:hypothetical protein
MNIYLGFPMISTLIERVARDGHSILIMHATPNWDLLWDPPELEMLSALFLDGRVKFATSATVDVPNRRITIVTPESTVEHHSYSHLHLIGTYHVHFPNMQIPWTRPTGWEVVSVHEVEPMIRPAAHGGRRIPARAVLRTRGVAEFTRNHLRGRWTRCGVGEYDRLVNAHNGTYHVRATRTMQDTLVHYHLLLRSHRIRPDAQLSLRFHRFDRLHVRGLLTDDEWERSDHSEIFQAIRRAFRRRILPIQSQICYAGRPEPPIPDGFMDYLHGRTDISICK